MPTNSGEAVELRRLRVEAMKLALAIAAGLGAVVALVLNYRRHKIEESQSHRDDQRLFTDRFQAAADQLGNQLAAVKLAGVHAMAQLADDWDERRQTCIDVLCGYIRLSGSDEPEVTATILRIIGERLRPESGTVGWRGCSFDFTGATFDAPKVDFRGADFSGVGVVSFADAVFSSPRVLFSDTTFAGGTVNFTGAQFAGTAVYFNRARFSDGDVIFDDTCFTGETASFHKAIFVGGRVSFENATFSGRGVYFSDVEISRGGKVDFDRAVFSGEETSFEQTKFCRSAEVEFRRVVFARGRVSFDRATFSGGTVRFHDAEVAEARVSFSQAQITRCQLDFAFAKFRGGELDMAAWFLPPFYPYLRGGRFWPWEVDFRYAQFSGTAVTFQRAHFLGGRVDLSRAADWTTPPSMPAENGTPPLGLMLPETAEFPGAALS